ncbi:MAG: hypothetical protein IV104_01140 [Acidovorax sp.]|nr:hypothetical protein [Acidovorax sp.]
MKKNNSFSLRAICAAISILWIPSIAIGAAIPFAQYPAGSSAREPAPNVIVSVDDSGSMGASGIVTLKDALKQTFADTNVPDGRIRLAWQSMNRCAGIPSSSTACGSKNFMKPLAGAHRTNFLTWVDTLTHGNGTPAHIMVRNAGDYLKTTGINSPWNSIPGTVDNAPIACRKAFHIFMTDGGWNSSEASTTANHVDGDRKKTGYTVIGGGNIDGNNLTLGDGTTAYTADSNATKIYYDQWGFGGTDGLNTISDLAFYYWATDLQSTIANNVKPIVKKSGDEIFGTGGTAKTIPEYWNPRNDPATWQHMVTYTIGFGTGASAWTGSPTWGGDTYSGDYTNLIQGTVTWPSPLCAAGNTGSGNQACDGSTGYSVRDNQRRVELWHTAINGRGKFVPAPDAASLVTAFKDILGSILEVTENPITNFIGASASVSRSGTDAYKSGYASNGWTGYIASDRLSVTTGVASANPDWGMTTATPPKQKTTADILDALDATGISNRLILTTKSDTNAGISFAWGNLHSSQQTLLNTLDGTADTNGSDRASFLRGVRTKESNQTGGYLRTRLSRQGDIVNSNIWYTGKPVGDYNLSSYKTFASNHSNRIPMLYVGGNDGMLHGFSAVDGTEKIAYIPKGIYKNLPLLTKTEYIHNFFVDASPFTGDVNVSSTLTADWRTYLVGTLGAGGKGYFVLDVTKPGFTGATGIASNFSTGNAASIVVMDKTADKSDTSTIDADIGHIFGDPVLAQGNQLRAAQITQMNNGRWAVVMGNGYNSTNEQAVLVVQYLDGDKAIKKISVGTAGDNGLSAPRLLDVNGDGLPDVAYAGDLKGNMWKFNLFSSDAANWTAAFSGSPLYSAVDASGTPQAQPITTAPTLAQNTTVGGLMVAFGTGRNLTEGDRTDTASVQTVYAVRDNTIYMQDPDATPPNSKVKINTGITPAAVGTGRSELVQQTVNTASATDGQGVSTGDKFYTLTNNSVNYSGTGLNPNKRGWYLDLPVAGERVLNNIEFFAGTGVLEIISKVPASGGNLTGETCELASIPEKTYRTFTSIQDGTRPTSVIMDVNGDGYFTVGDSTTGNASGDPFTRGSASNVELKISTGDKEKRIGADGKVRDLPTPPLKLLRPSWRQLQ